MCSCFDDVSWCVQMCWCADVLRWWVDVLYVGMCSIPAFCFLGFCLFVVWFLLCFWNPFSTSFVLAFGQRFFVFLVSFRFRWCCYFSFLFSDRDEPRGSLNHPQLCSAVLLTRVHPKLINILSNLGIKSECKPTFWKSWSSCSWEVLSIIYQTRVRTWTWREYDPRNSTN